MVSTRDNLKEAHPSIPFVPVNFLLLFFFILLFLDKLHDFIDYVFGIRYLVFDLFGRSFIPVQKVTSGWGESFPG